MMTVKEAADKWGVNENTIRKWARSGKIKAASMFLLMKERGLPPPGKDAWVVLQDDRPLPGLDPIDRSRAVPENDTSENEDDAPMNGLW